MATKYNRTPDHDVETKEAIQETSLSTMHSKDDAAEEQVFTKDKLIKNLIVINTAFLLLFTGAGSIATLEPSLNMENKTGSASLAIAYASLILSCLFLPPIMLAKFGCKWTLVISMVGYLLYLAANFYPVWGTMVPAGLVVGLAAAPLWSAKCSYLTALSVLYAKATRTSRQAVISRFFGIFFLFFQTYRIWGNIVVFTVLKPEPSITNGSEARICGAQFCTEHMTAANNTNLQRPVETKVYLLCGVFIAMSLSGMLFSIFFLDPLTTKDGRGKKGHVSPRLLLETIRLNFTSRYQQLLIPLTIYSGFEQAIISGEFTRSFVTCSLGIDHVGYVMLCYGVVDAVFSCIFGAMVKKLGQVPLFVLGFLSLGVCKVVLLVWVPDASSVYAFYLIAFFWGIGDAVIQPQVNALYGVLFKDKTDAAFSNYRLWESMGFVIHYAYNDALCTSTKIYISLAAEIAGMAGYTAVEFMYRREKKAAISGQI